MFYLKLVIVLLYELLLLIAISFIVGFLFLIFFDSFENSTYKYLLLRYLKVSICWIFFPFNFLAVVFLKNQFLHDIKTQNKIIDVRNKILNK
ncbi:MAG: hypothetical protein EBW93_00825 [Betaproteobacteria bacterium]|nr:hypothetical protein [Betaproteobacteria bacterium]